MSPDRNQGARDIRFLVSSEVRGVSKELLLDMRDIVDKWGSVSPAKQVVEFRSGDLGDDLQLLLAAPVDPKERGDMLIVGRGEITFGNFVVLETNLFRIVWDKGLTAKDAKEAVRRIDDRFKLSGLIDKTRQRLSLPPDQSIQQPSDIKRSVDIFFQNKPAIFVSKIDGRTKQQVLAEFDQPEKLEVDFIGEDAFVRLKKTTS